MGNRFGGNGAIFEMAEKAYRVLFEGKGMVCRIIDGTRDMLMRRGMPKDIANDTVIRTRRMFFDPFATQGVNPTTDPKFKRMLNVFPYMAAMMVDKYHYGTPGYDHGAAEDFSTKFVDYCRRNYPDGMPDMTTTEMDRVMSTIAGTDGTSDIDDIPEYSAIPVESWEELRNYSEKYRLGEWCIVNSREDWEKFTLYGNGRFYLLVSDAADPATTVARGDVLGIVVNHYGKVVYAFDRANMVADMRMVNSVAGELGLLTPKPKSFGTALDILRSNDCDFTVTDIYPWCERLNQDREIYVVGGFGGNEAGEYQLLNAEKAEYVGPQFSDYSSFHSNRDEWVILDANILFDISDETVVCRLPSEFTFENGRYPFLDDDMGVLSVRKLRAFHVVNGALPWPDTNDRGKLLLDESNETRIAGAKFYTRTEAAGTPRKRRVPVFTGMGEDEYWVVETPDKAYLVTECGCRLDECAELSCPADAEVIDVFSRKGYYSIRQHIGDRAEWYLCRDGKRVIDTPFKSIYRANDTDYSAEMETFDGRVIKFDPETEQIEELE